VVISLLIAFFNLIPLPPLDGSRILAYFLPLRWKLQLMRVEQFGIIVIVALLALGVLDVVLRGAEAVAVRMLGVDVARLSGLWW
jgi:Zn-dependent protease